MKSIFLKNSFLSLVAILLLSNTSFAQTLFFERIYDETLSQASYIVGDTETQEAIVIDPKRDIDTYLEIAKANNLSITYITETHIHADFLSGSRELAAATNAPLYLSDEGGKDWQYDFPHQGLKDGDQIKIGKIIIDVIHTPGHTPESLTFLVKDDTENPMKAITGDFIFVGDVGRPDLLEKAAGQIGSQEIGAKQLYHSIEKFLKLPDNTEIWPGHGAGSFCGKSLSNIPQSTLKQEKLTNPALQFSGKETEFVNYILKDQPAPPKYFAMMKHLNKVDRPLLVAVPKLAKLNKQETDNAIQNGLIVIDTRPKSVSGKGFIKGSFLIENMKTFSTFAGSIVDYQNQIILIAEENQIEDLTRKLMRIGMHNIYGYITNPSDYNLSLQKGKTIDTDTFKSYLENRNIQKIDVRTENEYKSGHINGVENIALNTLENNLDKINKNEPVIIHCQSGTRAAIAYSILVKNGFENILNYSGGINDWVEKKNELVK
ncbi:MBL fold metallo-hydrolase [Chryseobacterium flavum]|jgi:hydroxyacylglutathione hydrolase|uniref:MBL fold metallo-hydrolase n=1 Tax=Chryseobacterium flavum TaxID=415851 RepID=UPI0028B055AA|nr:MBL fold metallo-hydrolase [Chryseobacterium flavum]